jgi:hypothetical protein
MNIFFEFMSMILKNHIFKIDLNRFLKNVSRIVLICLVVQKNKVGFKYMKYWIFLDFLVNGHLKFTYALSTSKVNVIIYQSF